MERRFKVVLRERLSPIVRDQLVASFLEVDVAAESPAKAILDALTMYGSGCLAVSVTELIKVPS